jgi:hypothetical protein
MGEEKTFKSSGVLKRSSMENVYDAIEVNIFNKSIKDMQFIASLRQSIQAYLWSDSTLQWSIPIKLDKASFPIYEVPFKQIEVAQKMKFILAEEIVIQSQ